VDVFIGLDEGTIISQNGRGENISLNIMEERHDFIFMTLRERSSGEKGGNIKECYHYYYYYLKYYSGLP
jgi:hypothetical protein